MYLHESPEVDDDAQVNTVFSPGFISPSVNKKESSPHTPTPPKKIAVFCLGVKEFPQQQPARF